jgi:L-threonylcarbamoyladenylate synthase
MKHVSIEDPRAISLAADAMRGGGVIVLPTDTLYGFSAALQCRPPYDRIVGLKGSVSGRPFIALADSIDMAARYVTGWGSASRDALSAVWPAALTAVLPAGPACPRWFGSTLAVRVPDNDFVRRVVEALGEPIVSTSVNRAGEAPIDDADAIEDAFGDDIDLMVLREEKRRSQASTVVDFTVTPPRVLRQGDYAWPAGGKPSK